MKYQVCRTEKAEEQLREIIFYIADDSGDVNTALKYLDKLETSMKKLEDFPYTGNIPKYAILKKQGYRVLIIERHLVFYKVNEIEKMVMVYAILDGRREYKNLL